MEHIEENPLEDGIKIIEFAYVHIDRTGMANQQLNNIESTIGKVKYKSMP